MTKKDIIDRTVELIQDSSGAMRNLVGAWVNVVLNDISSRGLIKSLQREDKYTLVTTGRDYTIQAGTDKIFRVFVPAWGDPQGILTKKTPNELLQLILQDGSSLQGRPSCYTIFGASTLRIHPIADSDNAPASPTDDEKLHAYLYKDVAALSENDDITEFRPKHTPMIINGAYAFGARFDSLGDVVDATAKYEKGIVNFFSDNYLDLERPSTTAYQDL